MGFTALERRCGSCGAGVMELAGSTEHEASIHYQGIVPMGEMSQGRTLVYACRQCGERVTLLDPLRRGCYGFSIIAGVGMGVCGLHLGGGLGFLFVMGGMACVLVGGFILGRDLFRSARHPPK